MLFSEIIYFMLSMVKESSQTALERVFPQLQKEHLEMSRQAFSAARQKIKWEAFEELFQTSAAGSYQEELQWRRGYWLLAIDGSYIQLPSDQALLDYFGGLGENCSSASALASLLYDLENDIIVDAKIASVHESERALAEAHLKVLEGMDNYAQGRRRLIICDRGYPSHDFIKSLSEKKISYVLRVQSGFIRDYDLKGKQEGWAALGKTGMQVRLLHIPLSSGGTELLITNITESELEYEAFGELYNKRWGIETKYKELKQKLETENFSGRLADNVKQDFYAMMAVANMLASCVRQANSNAQKQREGSGNRHEYKVNVNHAIGVFKNRLIRVLIEEDYIARQYLMSEMIRKMQQRVVPVRPNRKVARKKHSRKARFHHNHKSNC